jgi:uncharacterized BrkB/YihY/UPF0761 family membrane protein
VPETALMPGENLSADNALATLRQIGPYYVARVAFIRFRYGDGVVRQTQSRSGESGQVALWLGLAAALVSLTTAMAQVERGANRIYGIQRDRPTTRKYGHALFLTFAAGLPAMFGFLTLVAGGAVGDALAVAYHWGDHTPA